MKQGAIAAIAAAVVLALPLAGCGSWDPTDIFDNSFFNPKKPLPGERKELFPQGTPGVQQGVPPELVKGYQPAAETQATVQPEAVPEESKPKPKAKPKPKVVVQQPAKQPGVPSRPAADIQAGDGPTGQELADRVHRRLVGGAQRFIDGGYALEMAVHTHLWHLPALGPLGDHHLLAFLSSPTVHPYDKP